MVSAATGALVFLHRNRFFSLILIGKALAHYEILAKLGEGGMGEVYLARDPRLKRDVALKILPASALASEEDRARFFREAQAAAQLAAGLGVAVLPEALQIGRHLQRSASRRQHSLMAFALLR